MNRKSLLMMAGAMAFSLSAGAQDCVSLYKKANSLKNSGKYEKAIVYYRQAMACDAALRTDCGKWIKYCENASRARTGGVRGLQVSSQEVVIPYQGGHETVNISSDEKWLALGGAEWCEAIEKDKRNLILQCAEQNNSTSDKVTMVTVKSGQSSKVVKVIQQGRSPYLEVGARNLNFPAKGTDDVLAVESNVDEWKVSRMPSWCKVEKQADGLHIIVLPNESVQERNDEIVVEIPTQKVRVLVQQGAGEEHLSLSQNNLVLNGEGDVHYLKVYTDAPNWFVGDHDTWVNVQRVGADSLRLECGKNIPNGEPRYGNVQIRTDRQTADVMLTQTKRDKVDLLFQSSIIGGRNISFGFSASYLFPDVASSCSGGYVGSVMDYGTGTSRENASYTSATGFSFGAFADIRLYKNIFLNAGVNFTQVKYKNEFNLPTTYTCSDDMIMYLQGEVQNAYKEEYTHTMLEIPVLASYRFKINEASHVQLSLGLVISMGLSSKMQLTGNTDSDTMHKYYSSTNYLADNSNYVWHTATSAEFDLYQKSVTYTTAYTTGNDHDTKAVQSFQASPFQKLNGGLRVGAAYEISGLSFGLYYTHMLTNYNKLTVSRSGLNNARCIMVNQGVDHGNSGGPVFVENGGKLYVIGIVSHGDANSEMYNHIIPMCNLN